MDFFKILGGLSIATIIAISAVALIFLIIRIYYFSLKVKFLETQIKKNELQINELEYKQKTYYTMRENEMLNVSQACTQITKYLKRKNRQESEEKEEIK